MDDRVKIIELKNASSLAKIISSKTAQDIIEFISKKEKCTATQIKKELSLPASTVHYNLKALVNANILDDSNFSYSVKGKEVVHYTLTNKLIIVVPQKKNMISHIKAIIPGILTVGAVVGVALIIKLFSQVTKSVRAESDSSFMAMDLAKSNVAPKLMEASTQTSPLIRTSTNLTSQSIPWYSSSNFFIGFGVAVVVLVGSYFLIQFIKKSLLSLKNKL